MKHLIFAVSLAAVPLAFAACGSEETSGGGAEDCVDYSTVDINACNGGPCTFQEHVLPIFRTSCGLSAACHAGTNPQEGLALGKPFIDGDLTDDEIDEIYEAIVGVPANRADMTLVAPGEPAESFLLAKVEYDDPSACVSCSPKGCGTRMPQATLALPEEEIAVLRAWIAAGAKND